MELNKENAAWSPPPVIERVLYELWARGSEDGNEHYIAMRDEVEYARVRGSRNGIAMPFGLSKEFRPGDQHLHNHPNVLNSFSNVDLETGGRLQGDVYMISADKSIYFARVLDNDALVRSGPHVLMSVERAAEPFLRDWNSGHCERINSAHWINLYWARAGIIDYRFRLGHETLAAVQAMKDYMKGLK